jgi:molybdate/tungstate transport system substrate-binding protein
VGKMGRPDRTAAWLSLGALALVLTMMLTSGCTGDSEKTTLLVVPAGSLLLPLEEVEAEFEALHPDIDVRIEGHGSIQAVRQVTDLHRAVDVIAVADESLIPDMMYVEDGDGGPYTDWYDPFATNEVVIAYTDSSRYADEISSENWYEVLARPDVRVGFSNPMLDACGYRALMVTALAEGYYDNDTLFESIIGDHFSPALPESEDEKGDITITMPELAKPDGEKVVIRDGSIYLLSLLDAGGMDYAFEYYSVAKAHGLNIVRLPGEINLGDEAFSEQYEKVSVKLAFERFASIGSMRQGRLIVYAITVPDSAPHPAEARLFTDFVVSSFAEGRENWPAPLPLPG